MLEEEVQRGVAVKLSLNNSFSNRVVVEDECARYEWWVEPDGAYYKVQFRIYAKPGVWVEKCREEVFASDGEHPDWVGAWSTWRWGDDPGENPFTYPNWAGAYWTPIRPGGFPVTIAAMAVCS